MFDQNNLPLSTKKIIKKTIAYSILPGMFFGLLAVVFGIMYYFSSITSKTSREFPIISWLFWGSIISFFLIVVAIAIYQYFYYKSYLYKFDEEAAEVGKGVISRAIGHVNYARLQNVYVDQDILDRIFGIYDVHYETAGETSRFYSHVDGLVKENADILVAFLNEKVKTLNRPAAAKKLNAEPKNNAKTTAPKTMTKQSFASLSRENCPLSSKAVMASTIMVFLVIIFVIAVMAGGILYQFVFTQMSPLSILLSVSITLLVIFILTYLCIKVWYKNFSFKFDEEKGEIKTKFLSQSVSYLYYNRIQNVNVRQSIIERFFGLYSVSIETAGETSGLKFVIPGLEKENAEKLKDFLLKQAKVYKGL